MTAAVLTLLAVIVAATSLASYLTGLRDGAAIERADLTEAACIHAHTDLETP